jgi:hypothetical protein
MRNWLKNNPLIFILFIGLMFQSCKPKQKVITRNLPQKSAQRIIEETQTNSLNYEWLSMRGAVQATLNEKTQSFRANIRVKKDSAIWVSILPALGIEAARILLTPDSVFFADKIHAKYFAGSYNFFLERFNTEVDFFLIQDLIDASPLDFDKDAVYTLSNDSTNYLLSTVGARKLRKALILKERKMSDAELDTVLGTMVNPKKERKLEKALRKIDDERLYLRRYKIDGETMRLQSSFLNDLSNLSILEITYTNFEPTEDENIFPSQAEVFMSNNEVELNIKIGISKVRVNQPQSLKFNIPPRYERID